MLKKVALLLVISSALSAAASAQGETVVVRPEEFKGVLVKPGMGIQTFQRFDGQPLNEGLRWSEEGPVARQPDPAARPDFPASSVAYCRWFWATLQPAPGQFRWEIIDSALEEARRHGQTLAIRLMPYDEKHPLPEWYQMSGARRANKPADRDGAVWQPDFADPLYLKHWGALVAAAGLRYDGHPSLDSVDVSSVGYWGEGWSSYMPAFEHQRALIDIYFDAFRRTPLLMNFDEPQALAYGAGRGAGWRLDCLGDMGGQWKDRPSFSHMLDFYPQQVVRAGIEEVWRRSPVSLETCWVPGFWKERGWDVDYILAQALRWHVSTLNVKSSAIPPEWRAKFDEFQKRMGYRLVLRRLEYPRRARAGAMAAVRMWWHNAGVAPPYAKYELALQFKSGGAAEVVTLPADARKWLPGDAVYDGTVFVPETLKPGAYRLRVALLDPRTRRPAVRLAIAGRAEDGWYDLGAIEVE
ncbi:MAG TPA: DUF4832 domain-containing protein [Pyrinomonadaceae bacterium]|jgi:hypothetical protein|nr:DUF4832 domain-containing protein [Pyrinomonadaceae bacterium]